MATAGEYTLLFTDIVDSTRLAERIGDAAALELWARHDRLGRDLVARHQGREIDRTDGFFLLFRRPEDAGAFAVAYHELVESLDLQARVALHRGPITPRQRSRRRGARSHPGGESSECRGTSV